MKKLKYLLLALLLIPISNVNASTINCSAPGSVTLGDTINVTFSGSLSSAASVWFAKIGSSNNVTYMSGGLSIDGQDGASMSHTVSFKATEVGTASFYAYDVDVSDGENSYSDSATCYVNIVAPTQNNVRANVNSTVSNKSNVDKLEDLSKDNSLKSLSIEGLNLSPKFDKDTLEYKVSVPSDKTSINVQAEVNDDKSQITGIGNIEVKEGNNVINVVVTAENGEERIYKINAYVQEKSPITVKINNKKYTVLKKLVGLDAPLGFESKIIKIKDNEVEVYYNEKLNYTLVGLKDLIGNINLYVYNEKNNTYIKYSPIVSNNVSIIVLDENVSIPHRYKKCNFSYNGKVITGYALDESSDFRLVYAIDVETQEKGFYLYDMKNNTIQRFYNDQVNIYLKLINKVKLAFLILGGFILFLTLIILILLSKNVKFKKLYISKRLNKIDNPIISKEVKYQDLDETKVLNEKKKKNKKEKTFLDE